MGDNVAILAGFTTELEGSNDRGDIAFLLVEPATDLDGTFRAWDMDAQGFIRVDGWRWTFDTMADHRPVELAVQCVPPGGEEPASFLFRRSPGQTIREGELVSPTFDSLATLFPWCTANGWASTGGLGCTFRKVAA